MLQRLPAFTMRWRGGDMSDAAYAGVYFLLWQIERHGRRFASRLSKTDARPDAGAWLADLESARGPVLSELLRERLVRYQFLGVIPNVSTALYHWLSGDWPLHLLERIPSPREVLAMQASGSRPVTVLSEFPRLMRPVLSKADGFAFMVHDLEHAYKLCHDPELLQGQTRFFTTLLDCIERGHFGSYVDDAVFQDKFDYLISDMNTHPAHSLQYLRAIVLEWHLRQEGKPGDAMVSETAWESIQRLLESTGLEAAAEFRAAVCPT